MCKMRIMIIIFLSLLLVSCGNTSSPPIPSSSNLVDDDIFLKAPPIDGGHTYTGDIAPLSVLTEPAWTLSITDDGQLMINGKAIEKMSDPEIKATMKELFKWLESQQRDRGLVEHYDRQTGYLLKELEACRNGKK